MIKFNLGEVLEKQGKTMYWLSKESGVRPNTISQWTNTEEFTDEKKVKSISLETLNSICEALDCKIEDLIEYVNVNEKTTNHNN